MNRRFKLEFVDLPDKDPLWFDDQESLDAMIEFTLSCPVDDGPVRLRVTEMSEQKVEYFNGR